MILTEGYILVNQDYSLLKATTGSHLDANVDGIRPEITESKNDTATSATPPKGGNVAMLLISDKCLIIKLIGIFKINVIKTPKIPLMRPVMNVSALKIFDTSTFDAPIALKIPISFVLSSTEI